jgi:hypothetical protein
VLSDAAVEGQYVKSIDVAEATIKALNLHRGFLSPLLRLQFRLHRAFGHEQAANATETPAI